jgi:hypothetical protein
MARAQIQSQVFVLILAAIVFALILVFGYSAIRDIYSQSQRVQLIDVGKKLESSVNDIALSYNSIKRLDLTGFPSQFKTFCLVTGRNPDELKGLAQQSPLIAELYQPDGSQKAFLQPAAEFTVKLDNVVASQKAGEQSPQRWFCTPIDRGTVTLRLEGLGNGVRISPW